MMFRIGTRRSLYIVVCRYNRGAQRYTLEPHMIHTRTPYVPWVAMVLVLVWVGGWGRGCDFARGRATAGYGHSIVTPTCPWTSCGDRRTRSHTPPLGSGPSPACPSNRHRTPSPERKWLSIGTGFSNLYTVCGRKTPSSSLTTPGHAYPPRVSGPASLLAMTRPFQTRIQSNIFDLVQYICRFVSLNKTRVLSCSFIPPEQCLLS